MWEQNLNLKTEIIVKESSEIEAIIKSGDFDVLRRGEVLPVADETANMMAIFPPKGAVEKETTETAEENPSGEVTENADSTTENQVSENKLTETPGATQENQKILTEEQAIIELPAIPLYFPTTYSLVKPYVQGFEMNTLDAPSLKNVTIDNNWQPNGSKQQQ